MKQAHIIRRTKKLRQLRELLHSRQAIYLSSFFYSGKTVLLDQLAEALEEPVARFDAERDDWAAFEARALGMREGVLLIDSLHRPLPGATEAALAGLLGALPEGMRAVMAGRAQMPECLRKLCASGLITLLSKDFVMFSKDEMEQLLLDYGLSLPPADIEFLRQSTWGFPFAMQIAAQKLLKSPGRSIRAVSDETRQELSEILIEDVVLAFPEQERTLLYNLSPFERFTEEMARMVTGRADAPRMMAGIAHKSYMLVQAGPGRYTFVPFVRAALFREMKNLYSKDYIDGLYKRAALYFELENRAPEAIAYYMQLGDAEKIRELLIRETHSRPASGDCVALREAYRRLSEKTLLASPALMKGLCMTESLLGRAGESERWYQALARFAEEASPRDARRRAAREALAWLDIALPHRGARRLLKALLDADSFPALTQSDTWRDGFNAADDSISLLNGGKDLSCWVPHAGRLYRLFREPAERALGPEGRGLADIALGETMLEADLAGNYGPALDRLCAGLSMIADAPEIRCAAVGIQSRIVAVQGGAEEALSMIDHLIDGLPERAPARLRENLAVWRLTLRLWQGDTQEALAWLESGAPDETGDFVILDRYQYMLKLRLYIVTGRWPETRLLCARLRHCFESYDRPYMRIQLHLLEAVIDRQLGEGDWRENLGRALALARRYNLVRVIADEGAAVVDMLGELDLPDGPWEHGLLRLTRAQAAHYPHSMKPAASRPMFTDREYQVYSLMIAGYRNAKIAAILNITERTVKHYTAEIYRKLGVATRAEALNRAAALGDMK